MIWSVNEWWKASAPAGRFCQLWFQQPGWSSEDRREEQRAEVFRGEPPRDWEAGQSTLFLHLFHLCYCSYLFLSMFVYMLGKSVKYKSVHLIHSSFFFLFVIKLQIFRYQLGLYVFCQGGWKFGLLPVGGLWDGLIWPVRQFINAKKWLRNTKNPYSAMTCFLQQRK